MSIASVFPAIKPTLLLDFENTLALDPRITFTRASTATFTNESGLVATAASDVPRFTYDPTTLEPIGLLIEEQRTNITNYSEQFNNAWWGKVRTTITADAILSPDGTVDADKLVEDTTASNTHNVRTSNYSTVSGNSYTWSIYLKAGERTKVRVALQLFVAGSAYSGNAPRADVDLTNGTLISSAGTIATSITSVGSGWYRVSVSATANAASSTQLAGVFLLDNADNANYTGDGTSGVYIWGAQLEVGAFATSYIPTVASQVTRAADAAGMTGANFSSWYRVSEGTMYAEATVNGYSADSVLVQSTFAINDGTLANSMQLRGYSTAIGSFDFDAQIFTSSALQFDNLGINLTDSNVFVRSSLGYLASNSASSQQGNPAQDAGEPILLPYVDQAWIGSLNATTNQLNGIIKKISYYPLRVTDAQLQGLTS